MRKFLVILLSFTITCSYSQELVKSIEHAEWSSCLSGDYNYSVKMPGIPRESLSAMNTPAGPLISKYIFADCSTNTVFHNYAYFSYVFELPQNYYDSLDQSQVSVFLDSLSKNIVSSLNVVVDSLSCTKIKYLDYEGREMVVKSIKSDYLITGRFYLIEKCCFMLYVVTPVKNAGNEFILKFLDSFEFPD